MAALRVNPVDIRQNRYAVVIGINKYRDPAISNLEYARADAEAVYRVLTDPQLGRIPKENVILLLDEAATQREIRKAVGTTLKQKAGEEDVVYIYYAGHGAPEIDPKSKSSDGLEKYLVPHDGEAEDLFSSAISMEEIRRFFERLIARQVIFFIDSCYSGEAGGRTFPDPRYRSRHLSGEFLENLAGEGRLVITACHVSEVSLELSALQHGLFTYHLLEGMRGKADQDGDGRVSIDELYQYLYRNVSEEARRLNGSMRPVRKGTAVGDLYITRYETAAQKEAEQLRPPAREAARRGEFPKALQAWRKIRQLLPGDEEANRFISAIEQKQREADEQKQRLLERRQAALLEYYQTGELSAEAYGPAMELLRREKETLNEKERKIHKLLCDLADRKIPLAVYRSSIALLEKKIVEEKPVEVEKKRPPYTPPAVPKTAAAEPPAPPPREEPGAGKGPEPPVKPVYRKWLAVAGITLLLGIGIYALIPRNGSSPGNRVDPYTQLSRAGDSLHALEQFPEALEKYKAALTHRPGDAYISRRIQDCEKEISATQAEQERNRLYTQYKNEGDALFNREKFAEAKEKYRQALNQIPGDRYAAGRLTECDQKIAGQAEAERSRLYTQYINKGDALLSQGKYPEAKAQYQQALNQKPGDRDATNKIAACNQKIAEQSAAPKPKILANMVKIPGGTFQMGSTEGDDDETPVHEVYIKDFYLGKYEVTFAEYDRFCEATNRDKPGDQGWGRGNRPVINVSWRDAVEYCNWRSRQEGLTPCYSGSGASITCDFNANGYRLPMEAEWEYAARERGKNVRFGNGKNIADPREINFDGRESYKQSYSVAGEYRGKTTPVGNFPSNALELYDMSGNVWEWCWDWYGSKYYEQRVKQSPEGPSNGSYRVLRGGSWGDLPKIVRCASRGSNDPDDRTGDVGFRLSRTF